MAATNTSSNKSSVPVRFRRPSDPARKARSSTPRHSIQVCQVARKHWAASDTLVTYHRRWTWRAAVHRERNTAGCLDSGSARRRASKKSAEVDTATNGMANGGNCWQLAGRKRRIGRLHAQLLAIRSKHLAHGGSRGHLHLRQKLLRSLKVILMDAGFQP